MVWLMVSRVDGSPKVLEDYERLLMKIKDKFKELNRNNDEEVEQPEVSSGRFTIPPSNRLTTAHPIKLPVKPKVRKTANLFSPFIQATTPGSPLNYTLQKDQPESRLRIRKIKNSNNLLLSSDGDDTTPFEFNPNMFEPTDTTAAPTSTTTVMVPMFMLDTESIDEVNEVYTSTVSSKDVTEVNEGSTIVDNARFSYLETPIVDPLRKRRRYHPRRPLYESVEDYDEEDFYPRRPKYHRRPAYYDDFDWPKRRYGHRRYRYSKYRPIAEPVPLSVEEDSEEFENHRIQKTVKSLKSGTAGSKTFEPHKPLPVNTLSQSSQFKEGAGLAGSKYGFIPKTTESPKKPIQMSMENCRKVNSYAKIFGVSNPQKWVRHNCAFVQTFVKAPCTDINSFVDSCYKRNT
ncbi:unnamed protein product [Bursaphelenchus okinawaensis]|uniref:aECM cysteine-cradle domain-containing protein n=1 Tax=Bursaphelenchus okinawaensis TaxID=465554 RepID=A0A811KU84_9BILA|nr:unnamed protein product [Bursaphelenchus okinawaensis]CAG9112464.1 unnamed protein product [Bursaphelenchus okinawaensis]